MDGPPKVPQPHSNRLIGDAYPNALPGFSPKITRDHDEFPLMRTKDTGTLQYDIYFNDDQSEGIVLERFRDSEALIDHAEHLGDLMEAIPATGSVSGELLR